MSTRKVTYTEFLDEAPMSGFLWSLIFGICFAQVLDGLDFMSTSFALPGIMKSFALSPVHAGLVGSVSNTGEAVGAILFTIFSDRFGRRPIFQWVIFSYVFGTLICALAPNLNTLLAGRAITGLGLGSETPIAIALMAEYSPKRLRHILAPMPILFFGVGWVVAAGISVWLIPAFGWRSVYWVGLAPAVSVIIVRRFIPESIRFLLGRGRVEEAGVVARDVARRIGRTDLDLVPPEMAPISPKQSFAQQLGALKMMWVPGLVLLLFMVTFYLQTFGMNAWLPTIFVRHGFKLSRSFTFSMVILVASPLSHLLTMWLQNKINRKWLLFIFTLVSTVFFILFGISFHLGLPTWVMVGSQFIAVLFGNPLVSITLTLCSELFPTQVRTFGMGIVSCAGRLGGAMGPLFIGMGIAGGMSIFAIVNWLAIPMVVGAILVVVFIRADPRNKSLEAIIESREAVHAARII